MQVSPGGGGLPLSVGMVVVASVAFGLGGVCMKLSDGFTPRLPSVAVTVFFVVGAVILTQAVRTEGLSMAYTVGLGVDAVFTLLIGLFLFHERLSPTQLLGAGMILGVSSVRLG